jgi:hypothetical protein
MTAGGFEGEIPLKVADAPSDDYAGASGEVGTLVWARLTNLHSKRHNEFHRIPGATI